MIRQPDIQYVQFSFDGTAARKLENRPQASSNAKRKPQQKRRKRAYKVVRVETGAILSLTLACVMVIVLAAGMLQLGFINAETEKMENYISVLQAENNQLQAEYDQSIDVEEVRQKALAMGLVPKQDTEQITISVRVPTVQEVPTVWDQIGTFLAGLFA